MKTSTTLPGEKAPLGKSPVVPGGKALARLEAFVRERNLPMLQQATAAKRPLRTSAKPYKNGHVQINYLEGYNSLKALQLGGTGMSPPSPVAVAWRPLGPFAIPHGQTYGSGTGSRPAVAGRVGAIAIDPANSNHVLIGAAGGGLWETRDGGITWAPRTDDQPSLAIGAIAFDPSNPAIVYAGSGEGDFYGQLGVGLFRSTDGGTTWTLQASTPFVGGGFYDLDVDPLDGTHLLAATWFGVYESANSGATWTQRRSARAWDLSIHPAVVGDPNSTKEILAACSDGLFRSTNGGTSWSSVTLPGLAVGVQRMEVCHAPSDGGIAYVYAAASGSAYIARRDSIGGSFTQITTTPTGINVNQAWYDWCAAVAPNNPDILFVGAIDSYKGTRDSAGNWTWESISARSSGDSIHPDQHHIAISPADPTTVYIGCDGGIYRSSDAGTTWKPLNKGLCITEFEYLARHPQYEGWLLGGTQDNGSLRYEGQPVWYHIQDGDGGDCGINDSTPLTCFHSFYNMGLQRSTTGGGWGSWTSLPLPIPAGHSSLFYPPMDVKDGVVVQAGSSLLISSDSGATWTAVNLPSGVASALCVASPTRIYAGTTSGDVFRTELSGGGWSVPVALTHPAPSGYISDFMVDPTNPARLWCTYTSVSSSSFVYRSDDAGMTWIAVGSSLPQVPINAIELDPAATNTVFAAADVGVYRSNDAGVTWMSFNNGLPNALAKDLLFHGPSRLLRVATQSRGVWEIPVDASTIPNVEVYVRDTTVDTGRATPSPSGVQDPFSPGAITYWWQCPDVKVDAPPYQESAVTDVDFQVFQDDHGVFAAGLQHENAQRGQVARVYVQVHNRGVTSANSTAVKVFFADASVAVPDLPAGFWTNFPNNVVGATSPWQPIASHQTISTIAAGRSQIVGFEWPVPPGAADHTCLLIIVNADNDSLSTSELNVGNLVTNNKKCGLKNLTIVNPPPSVGTFRRVIKLNIWPTARTKYYRLKLDRPPGMTIRGFLLSNRLAKYAKENQLKQIKLTDRESSELTRLVERFPNLKKQISATNAYAAPPKGIILWRFELPKSGSEPLIVLVGEKPQPGSWSIIQYGNEQKPLGGFTFVATQANGLYPPPAASAPQVRKNKPKKPYGKKA